MNELTDGWWLLQQRPLEIIGKMIKCELFWGSQKVLILGVLYELIAVIREISAGPGYIDEMPTLSINTAFQA